MARAIFLLSVLLLLNQTSTADGQAAVSDCNSHSPFRITAVGKDVPNALARLFSKQVDVFGIRVLATKDTPDKKVHHAANVMAQYLDNDADGTPDNPRVLRSMQNNKATLIMFATADAA